MSAVLVPPGTLVQGAVVELPEEEGHHLRVRRATPGEAVQLLDGAGVVGDGTITAAGPAWRVAVREARAAAPLPPLVLAVGAGDRERFALVVEKAAELGVTEVVPLDAERSRHVAGRVRPRHLDGLRRRAREALKQSGGAWAPEVTEPVEPARLTGAVAGARWLADPEGGAPPPLDGDGAVTVAIGPEGGFTPAERDALLAGGFVPVRLGPRILRFETAAVAAAVAVHLRRSPREAR